MVVSGKKAEKPLALLKDSEKRLRLIIDNTSDPIYIKDKEGRMIMANPACEHAMGHTIDEMRGKNDAEIYANPQIGRKILETDKNIMNSGKTQVVEEEIDTPGGIRIYLSTKTPLFDYSGRVTGIFGISRDITERKQAEEALRKSTREYELLFSNMSSGFAYCKILFDEEGKAVDFIYLQINEMFEKITGLKSDVIVGRKVTEAIPGIKEATPELFEIYGRVAQTGVPEKFEINFIPLKKWLSISVYSPEKGYFAAVFEDITERKKAEEALKQAQTKLQEYASNLEQLVEKRTKAIRESEKKYHELYESFGEAFIATDWEFTIIHWNKAAEKITTVKATDALGKKFYDVLPEFLTVDVTPYYEALRRNRPVRFIMNVTSRETKKPSLFEVSTYPSTQGIIYIVEDKTEEERNKRLSVIGATAGMVGHDIRNPLQAMISDVYLMRSELTEIPACSTKEGVRESLESLENNILYVSKVVGDLQDYTRPLQPNIVPIKVTDKISNVLKNVRLPQNIRLHINAQEGLVVETDADYLRRALTNLINNALQAMPNGGDLTIEAKAQDSKVLFSVQDTGVGISDEAKANLFMPLFTTKSKGQGLGLAVVKRLVEALNGQISFESEEGKGTKFIIQLPITQ